MSSVFFVGLLSSCYRSFTTFYWRSDLNRSVVLNFYLRFYCKNLPVFDSNGRYVRMVYSKSSYIKTFFFLKWTIFLVLRYSLSLFVPLFRCVTFVSHCLCHLNILIVCLFYRDFNIIVIVFVLFVTEFWGTKFITSPTPMSRNDPTRTYNFKVSINDFHH